MFSFIYFTVNLIQPLALGIGLLPTDQIFKVLTPFPELVDFFLDENYSKVYTDLMFVVFTLVLSCAVFGGVDYRSRIVRQC